MIKFYYTVLFSILLIQPLLGQNDECIGAINLGNIIPNENPICIDGNTANTNPSSPPTNLLGCTGGDLSNPDASDVWYEFTPTGNNIEINMSGYLLIDLGFYLATGDCNNLVVTECYFDADGFGLLQNYVVVPGERYYINIQTGRDSKFNLCIKSTQSGTGGGGGGNNTCVREGLINLTPAPISGTYQPGQNVEICLTINGYYQSASDWLHGIVPVFEEGWDLTSISNIQPPASCDGGGEWKWYNKVIGTNTQATNPDTVGPGFFYERFDDVDLDPGNNFGDNCSNGFWKFCLNMRTKDFREDGQLPECPADQSAINLNVVFENYSDSETGSWDPSSPSICSSDPTPSFNSVLACCIKPQVEIQRVEDENCNQQDGSILLNIEGGILPYSIRLTDSLGNLIAKDEWLIKGLSSGDYLLEVAGANGCFFFDTIVINNINTPTIKINNDTIIDYGSHIILSSNQTTGDFSWYPPSGLSCFECPTPVATPKESTTYILSYENEQGCEVKDTVFIEVIEFLGNIYVPTGFTPNGDNINDIIFVNGEEVSSVDIFRVYDRWGELVFEQTDFQVNDETKGWNGTFKGKVLNQAVFTWYVEATLSNDEKIAKKGNFTLFR